MGASVGPQRFFLNHACSECVYLTSLRLNGFNFDLYAHGGDNPTVVARYGDLQQSFLCGSDLASTIHLKLPGLDEDHQALRIAWLIANDLGITFTTPKKEKAS